MLKNRNKARIALVLSILMLAAMACNLPGKTAANPVPTSIPMTDEEVTDFESQLAETLDSPDTNGEITIAISEPQLNAYIAAQLARDPDETFKNPQVDLKEGEVIVTGQVLFAGIYTDAIATAVPYIDESAKPRLKVESITLAGVPVPQPLVDQVDGQVDSSLADYLASSGENISVRSIEVTEASLIMTGTRQ